MNILVDIIFSLLPLLLLNRKIVEFCLSQAVKGHWNGNDKQCHLKYTTRTIAAEDKILSH